MALAAGDIAIVGLDTDAPDRFAFVLLADVAAGEAIKFTDNGWLASGALRTGENLATWTAPAGGLTAGTVITVNAATASAGTVTGGLTGLSASGDQILAYQGADTSPVLLYAVNDKGAAVWQADAADSNSSALPTGLVNGTTAVALAELDNYTYTGTTTGTKAQLLAAISNPANWTGNDTAASTYPVSFTVQAGAAPAVNLAVSTSTGTEAGATVITLTATAASAVTGNQTVAVTVSGAGITAGDFTLSGTQITILSGQTAGTVTFTVQDDALVEGSETATISIASPSAGITLGATTTQTITLTDNDAGGSLGYSTGTLNEARALDGSIHGRIVITLAGDSFTGGNGDDLIAAGKATVTNVPAGLTAVLSRTSSTTAELSFTGAASNHANANDAGNVGIAFGNTAFTGGNASAITAATRSDLALNFGDPASAGSTQTFTPNAGSTKGSSDASTALALDANWMVVGDDEANVLRVYPRDGGAAVAEWSYETNGPLLAGGELDLEASTRIGDTLYFMGSHSNSKTGAEANNREFIFSVTVSGTGAATQFSYLGQYGGLESALTAWDSGNAHGKGANYFGLGASSAATVVPEAVNGFSIEGMTASQDGTQLLLAFRGPQSDTAARTKAIIVPVAVAGLIGGSSPTFGTPIELDLGGRGIRSIEKAAGGGYLIIAGPAGTASTEATNDFHLFRWDGTSSTATELNTSLDTLLAGTGGSFETLVDVQGTNSGLLVQLLQDNGDTIWPGKTLVSKDLPAGEQQFQGTWVALGTDVTDAAAPVLQSHTPADDAINVAVNANLVLRFDEGVKAGAGSFVIRKVSDNSVVETIAAGSAGVTIAYNTVTLNPAADLAAGTAYYIEAAGNAITDHAGNAWAGLSGATAYNFSTANGQTVLNAGDLLFLGANSDATDAFAFVIMTAVTAGTQIGFSDRDYSNATGMPATGESAFLWTADQNYAAGTIVTIRPDVSSGNPLVDKGTVQGKGGGLSTTAETVYAFQGSIAGLANGAAGAITVDRLLASINVGGAAAGDIPAALTAAGASIGFSTDNAIYTGLLDRTNLVAFATLTKNSANWTTNDTTASTLTGNSLFGAPLLSSAGVNAATLTLTLNSNVDSTQLPATSAFAIKVNGAAGPGVTAVAATGNTVTLTLATPVINTNTVTVSYTDPTAGNDANAIQDTAGNDTASFTDRAVANSTAAPSVGASLTTPYTEAFTTSLADFTSFSVDADTTNKWFWNATARTAEVNGFGDTAPANDWLVSKSFDLTQTDVEYLSFTTWTRFADPGIANPEVKVKYSTNYSGSGNPALATWTDLSYTYSPEDSQQTTASGLINLSGINGNNVFFAFQYTSSGTASNSASSWRLDDVKIEGYTGSVVSIAAADASKNEGNSASTAYTFTVTRAGTTSGVSTVDWAVSGAAVDAADFGGSLPSGSVSFAASETSKTITVNASGDTVIEANEAFTVTLSNASGASIAVASATGSIQTDDVNITKISAVQGTGTTAALNGQSVFVEGIVTAYLPNLRGFYIQEEVADHDADANTSEGLFVFYGNTPIAGLSAATVGDVVRIGGTVGEFNGLTQLAAPTNFTVVTDNATASLPAPVNITLPVASMVNWEAVEGMRVHITSATPGGKLVVTDNFSLGQYGQVTLTSDALIQQFTETGSPSVSGYTAYQTAIQKDQIILDDGNSNQNPDPNIFGRGGSELTASNTLRAGDSVTGITGIVDQLTASGVAAYQTTYRVQATEAVNFTGDARPTAGSLPAAITSAEIKVASANVLNYFTSFGTANFNNANGTSHQGRGATNAAEFTRQKDKIVANLLGLNADVVGLMEVQNNGFGDGTSAIDSLVDALNAVAGAGTYAYIAGPFKDGNGADAVTAGDDAIMVGMLYKPGKVTPVGQAAVPDVTNPVYNAFTAAHGNRVPLAQTFRSNLDNEVFTLVVNHFKSKGSVIDADTGDGQGANNQARMEAARDLLTWLGTNPTGTADPDILLVGDFNAYGKEDPITYIDANGYDKVSTGLSYSFDGLWGSLDHALASNTLAGQVAGSAKWGINAEEPPVLDYNTEFKTANHAVLLYGPDPYRSSDHNPILIGLNLGAAPAPAPASTGTLQQAIAAITSTINSNALALINRFLGSSADGGASIQVGSGTSLTSTGSQGEKQGALLPGATPVVGNIQDGALQLALNLPAGQGLVFQGKDNASPDEVGTFLRSLIDGYLPAAPAGSPEAGQRASLYNAVTSLIDSMKALGANKIVVRVMDFFSTGSPGNSIPQASGQSDVLLDATASASNELFALNLGSLAPGKTLVLKGVENVLLANAGTVRVEGSAAVRIANDLQAQAITGGGGNDILIGGGGNDIFTGGAGNDIFGFAANGHYTVTDFNKAGDKLAFNVAGITSVAQVVAHLTGVVETAAGVTFNFGPLASVELVGLAAADVSADMVKFQV